MTIIGALKLFSFGLIIAISIGLLIRSHQEKIHPSLWYLVIVIFSVNLIYDMLLPIILSFKYLTGISRRNYSFRARFRLSLLAIPAGYYFIIKDNNTFSDEKFWKPFRLVSFKLRKNWSKFYEIKKIQIAKTQFKNNSKASLMVIESKLNELKAY